MDHQSIEEAEVIEGFEESNGVVKSVTFENHEKKEMEIHSDKIMRVKVSGALLTDQIKEEIQECDYQTVFDIKNEIKEVKEGEIKIQPKIVCEPYSPPPPTIQLKKFVSSKVNPKTVKKPRGRTGRKLRPILPMIRPIASSSTSRLEQALTQHQLIVLSTQMPGIAYHIFLGDHGKNLNNPVQYTMMQPQPVFLQPSPTSVSNIPPVVINQSYPIVQPSVPSPKIPKIVGQANCTYCYKLFKNVNEHVKDCWANPKSKCYKFRKIAPSTL